MPLYMTRRNRLGARNKTCGEYRVVEARSIFDPSPATATWRVYFQDALEPISEHGTRQRALAAVARYQEGDRRRRGEPRE